MKKFVLMPLAALAVAACDNPAGVPEAFGPSEIVITQGISAPIVAPRGPVFSTLENASPSLGGSTTTRLSINGTACSTHPSQQVVISYTRSGNQTSPASVKVNAKWDYNGSAFVGSEPYTLSLPTKSGGGSEQHEVTISVENSSGVGSGNASFTVAPFDLVTNTSDSPGQRLSLDATSSATVYVEFNDCTPTNTAPSLTIPADIIAEATSSAGAVVTYSVGVTDAEESGLTAICSPASGSTFALGETTVNCSVTDSGGLSDSGSFKVNVVDTTPPVISGAPTSLVTLIADDIGGATYDASGITASDLVDGTVSVQCSPLDLGLGLNQKVTCTATDAAGNPAEEEFYVSVTLNNVGTLLLTPVKADGSSAFKQGSTVPVKFAAPAYAGGVATDLAAGFTFKLLRMANEDPTAEFVEINESILSTNSHAWRYDDGQYIFNLSTKNLQTGKYRAEITYAGIAVAEGIFNLKR